MRIRDIIWFEEVEEKIIRKHRVWPEEAEQVMEHEDRSSLSHSRSYAELAEFWDSHDATEFDTQTREVEMEFDLRSRRHYIAIDPEVLSRLREEAAARGLSAESLANLWLQERILKQHA
ncbi:MAG TPA: CopG family antitoxin [Anaerolineae bacterium]|nr:CopG family antitoxin [Anaerolineae bacterium]